MLLTLYALGISSPGGMAALCIGVGALSVPLAYPVGRRLLDERRARVATLLLAFAPGALIFGATSADAVYLTLGLLAAWPLTVRAWRPLGAAMLAVASLFSWSLLAVGAWAAIVAWRREGIRAALSLSAFCAVALLAFYAALYGLSGYDPIGTLRATEDVYRAGIASLRPYSYWVLGSPSAFLLVLGLPILWYALRSLADRQTVAVAIFAVLAFAARDGVHQGRDGADLAVLRAVRLSRGRGSAVAAAAPGAHPARGPGARLRVRVRHDLVSVSRRGA